MREIFAVIDSMAKYTANAVSFDFVNNTYLVACQFTISEPLETGDTIYLENRVPDISQLVKTRPVDFGTWFGKTNDGLYLINIGGSHSPIDEDKAASELWNWISTPNAILKLVVGTKPFPSLPKNFSGQSFDVSALPSGTIIINKKKVASITIDNKPLIELGIGDKILGLVVKGTVTQTEVESFVLANTTWGNNTPPSADVVIGANDYTTVKYDDNWANQILLTGYTWPATVTTVNSLLITFKSDMLIFTSNGHIWVSEGTDDVSKNAIKVITPNFATGTARLSIKAGETWFFSSTAAPVKVSIITATIDTTAKLKGLLLEYSKSSGIADGEVIIPTVKYDPSLGDLNGGKVDVVFAGITMYDSHRTISDSDIESYIASHITWGGNRGLLDVSKWPTLYVGTKLYIANPQLTSAVEATFTVQADHGFTVNGAATYDHKYTPTVNLLPSADVTIRDIDYGAIQQDTKYGNNLYLTSWVSHKPSKDLTPVDSINLYVKEDTTLELSTVPGPNGNEIPMYISDYQGDGTGVSYVVVFNKGVYFDNVTTTINLLAGRTYHINKTNGINVIDPSTHG